MYKSTSPIDDEAYAFYVEKSPFSFKGHFMPLSPYPGDVSYMRPRLLLCEAAMSLCCSLASLHSHSGRYEYMCCIDNFPLRIARSNFEHK